MSSGERVVPINLLKSPYFHQRAPSPPTSKRQSLLVTLDDGTETEIQGTVTKLGSTNEHFGGPPSAMETVANGNFKIEEIGEDTLKREMSRERSNSKSRDQNGQANGEQTKVRIIPIKLHNGKLVQREDDEVMEIKAEFNNYNHKVFHEKPQSSAPERLIPIRLADGAEMLPVYSKLEDLEPPDWSAFSPKNPQYKKEKENIVPIKLLDDEPVDRNRTAETVRANPPANGSANPPVSQPVNPPYSSQPVKAQSRQPGIPPIRHPVSPPPPKPTDQSGREAFLSQKPRSFDSATPAPIEVEVTRVEPNGARVEQNGARMEPSGGSTRVEPPKRMGSPASALRGSSASPSSLKGKSSGKSEKHSVRFDIDDKQMERDKAITDLDRDINKIWRELQELESLPTGKPTPVKVRTYTTPTPTSAVKSPSLSNRTSYPPATDAYTFTPKREFVNVHPSWRSQPDPTPPTSARPPAVPQASSRPPIVPPAYPRPPPVPSPSQTLPIAIPRTTISTVTTQTTNQQSSSYNYVPGSFSDRMDGRALSTSLPAHRLEEVGSKDKVNNNNETDGRPRTTEQPLAEVAQPREEPRPEVAQPRIKDEATQTDAKKKRCTVS